MGLMGLMVVGIEGWSDESDLGDVLVESGLIGFRVRGLGRWVGGGGEGNIGLGFFGVIVCVLDDCVEV